MTIQNEQEFLASYDRRDYDAPLLTVDMAIFSVLNGQLQVLLIKRPNFPAKNQWALPGGFADLTHDQDLMATAYRKLVEKQELLHLIWNKLPRSAIPNVTRVAGL